MESSTTRFSNRVDNYARYRPSYPADAVTFIQSRFSLTADSVVADIGAGTGLFTQLLLDAGLQVTAVEPNDAMRAEADRLLSGYPGYSSVAGSAEQTGIEDHSVDLVTAAQAFHWFDPVPTRNEFSRILKSGAGICLIWNKRDASSGFLQQYESLLSEMLPEYNQVKHTRFSDDDLVATLGRELDRETFNYQQSFNLDGLKGRVMSSSYCPVAGEPGFAPFMQKLEALFNAHQHNGQIVFSYLTQVYCADV